MKSSTEVKDEHIDDVAFQLHVATGAGLKVSRVEIVHVNKEYVRKEQGLEPKRYFRRVDVTAEVKKRVRDVPDMITAFSEIIDDDPTRLMWSRGRNVTRHTIVNFWIAARPTNLRTGSFTCRI